MLKKLKVQKGNFKMKKKSNKKKTTIITSVIGIVFIVGGFLFLTDGVTGTKEDAKSYGSYTIKESEPLLFKGSVEAQRKSDVYVDQTLGKVQQVLVADNQQVAKGAGLFTYPDGKQATADIAGIVSVDENAKESSSAPLVRIASPETYIVGNSSEYDYERLAAGQQVNIKVLSTKEDIKGSITAVDKLPTQATSGTDSSPTVASYQFIVQPEKPLQNGYSVQIVLPQSELKIPKSAVHIEGEQQFVFLYSKGKAVKQPVSLVESAGLYTVKTGLKLDDVIISKPDQQVKDGAEIKVTK